MAVRFCEQCKQPFQEGYIYDDIYTEYYCSDECLVKKEPELTELTGATLVELQDAEVLYYTEWHSVEPGFNLMKVYTHPSTVSLWAYEKDAAWNLVFNGHIGDTLQTKWLLITDKEENALYKVTKIEGNTTYLELTHEPFTHPDQRTFDTLELAKQAYLEEEEN